MPGELVLVDTGPLVALFDPSDRWHEPCRETLGSLRSETLVTTLAVVTEATCLLGFSARAQSAVLRFLAAGTVDVAELGARDLARAAALMERYADLPMDFGDASLVVLAERLGTRRIFTLDRRDFGVYRIGRRGFRVLPTPAD